MIFTAMEAANQSIEGGSGLELILTVAIVAPLVEELLFRGIAFRSMKKVFPVKQGDMIKNHTENVFES